MELLEREQDSASAVLAVTLEAYGDAEEEKDAEEFEIGRIMPGSVAILGIGFSIISLVLIGLPPFSGFLSKFAILNAIMGPDAVTLSGFVVMRTVLAALLVLSGVVALIALSRMAIRTFWAPVEPFLPRITVMETAPILLLLGLLVALAVMAGPAMDLFLATAQDLHDPYRYLDAVLGAERVPPFAETSQ